jgi:hypothetical protein
VAAEGPGSSIRANCSSDVCEPPIDRYHDTILQVEEIRP